MAARDGSTEDAKNTLERNYLYFARKLGVQVHAERQVTHVEPLGGGGYLVHQKHPWDRAVTYPPLRAQGHPLRRQPRHPGGPLCLA